LSRRRTVTAMAIEQWRRASCVRCARVVNSLQREVAAAPRRSPESSRSTFDVRRSKDSMTKKGRRDLRPLMQVHAFPISLGFRQKEICSR
jgi:hypothetical protein